jgi:hypothetical protein
MEYVGAINMRHDAGLRVALRMTIAGHMRALVDHQDFVPRLGEGAADDGAAESGPDDAIPHGIISALRRNPWLLVGQSMVD